MEGCEAGILNRPDRLPPQEKKKRKTPIVLFYIPELSFLFLTSFCFFISSPTWLPTGVRGGSKTCIIHHEQQTQTETGIPRRSFFFILFFFFFFFLRHSKTQDEIPASRNF
jgi:hypothetical protein